MPIIDGSKCTIYGANVLTKNDALPHETQNVFFGVLLIFE